jgi:hypothetical protein
VSRPVRSPSRWSIPRQARARGAGMEAVHIAVAFASGYLVAGFR